MMTNSEWEGETHILHVTSVRSPDPADQFDDGELEYEIEHLPSCPKETFGWPGHEWEDWNCDVAQIAAEGLEFALAYSGTPITGTGDYKIRSWGSKTYYYDYGTYEYDQGVGVVDDEED